MDSKAAGDTAGPGLTASLQLLTVCGAMVIVYSIRFLCMAVLRMHPTELRLYHVWPGKETDA